MKTVLITGASSGIGMAYAKRFAKEGYHLVLVARRKEILDTLAAELMSENDIVCHVIPMDLSEEGAAKRIYEEVLRKQLRIDILINNAGFATKGLLEWADYEKQHREMQVNMVALVELTYFFISDMSKRREGIVIHLGSAASFNPVPYNAVYAATKAFVLSFSQAIEYEYRDKGIQVITICPQATDTHFFDDFNKMSGKMRIPEEVVESTFKAIKKKKIVQTDGCMSYIQSKMHHLLSRKMRVRITGLVGKKIWGSIL